MGQAAFRIGAETGAHDLPFDLEEREAALARRGRELYEGLYGAPPLPRPPSPVRDPVAKEADTFWAAFEELAHFPPEKQALLWQEFMRGRQETLDRLNRKDR